jgi:hypothetical protein
LGSLSLNISYTSNSYTSRIRNIWIVNFNAPTTATLILTSGASLLSTSIIPFDLKTVKGQINIVSPSGVFSINYALGEVETNPKPSQNTGYDQAFYWMASIFAVIFSLITIIYWRLGKN